MPRKFDFDIPVDFFEKSSADAGKQRRIGGIASLETEDQQGEVLLQRGLDFTPFLTHGWFNDNHSKSTSDVLGYPEGVEFFQKGDKLPSGKTAPANGHWVEGYLLDTPKADEIWKLGKALAKTNRRLGFSVEGKIQRRLNKSNTVAQALVRNVAITNCPVHAGAKMDILAKSLQIIEENGFDDLDKSDLILQKLDDLEKTLTAGTSPTTPPGPVTGEGAGAILQPESLESDVKKKKKTKCEKDEAIKSLSKTEAFGWVRARLPTATNDQIERFIQLTRELKG